MKNALRNEAFQPHSACQAREMPAALPSLAVWPVLSGLTFLLRSFGVAYNETVVALLDRRGSWPKLRQFTGWMALATVGLHLLIAATPLAFLYFTRFSALSPDLTRMAQMGFWIALPLPVLSVLQSWFQGAMLYGKRTRGVPESVVIFLITALVALGSGVAVGRWPGLYVAMSGMVLATLAQTAWLWGRSRSVMAVLRERDFG